ncbi:MAG: hypothetical protein HRU23_10950 [Gammaproteobacteria bacterium]|nr:hypothetical protein [Gammaproteobacteria bacterium]
MIDIISLIITARDPATVLSFNKLLPALACNHQFEVIVLTQEPASSLVVKVNGIRYFSLTTEQLAIAQLQAINERKKIDAVLTGISGPDRGIDEIALEFAYSQKIPNYALQSFWGDFNPSVAIIPDTLFTLDQQASDSNQARFPDSRNIAIGSIKHIDYSSINSAEIRQHFRDKLVLAQSTVIGFYGQPLAEVEGYLATLTQLVDELQRWDRQFTFVYRPHPKESANLKTQSWQLFQQAFGVNAHLDTTGDVIDSLCGCDIVVSAFSTCCIDAVYLNINSKQAINSSVYLLFEPELVAWWQRYAKIEEMPLTGEHALILKATMPSRILPVLEQALADKSSLRSNAIAYLPSPKQAVNLIIETIKNDILG